MHAEVYFCSTLKGACLTSLTRSKGVFSAGDFPEPCSRQGLTSQCHSSLRTVDVVVVVVIVVVIVVVVVNTVFLDSICECH